MKKKVDIGAVAEHLFAAELLRRGIMPSWPSSQMQPYDLVADLPRRPVKVQVKGTERSGPVVDVRLLIEHGKGKFTKYSPKEIDYVAVYLFEYGDWYILPIKDIDRTSLRVKPNNPACQWLKYKEAWHLLK